MRLLGICLQGIRKFCAFMELTHPVFQSTFDRIILHISSAGCSSRRKETFSCTLWTKWNLYGLVLPKLSPTQHRQWWKRNALIMCRKDWALNFVIRKKKIQGDWEQSIYCGPTIRRNYDSVANMKTQYGQQFTPKFHPMIIRNTTIARLE